MSFHDRIVQVTLGRFKCYKVSVGSCSFSSNKSMGCAAGTSASELQDLSFTDSSAGHCASFPQQVAVLKMPGLVSCVATFPSCFVGSDLLVSSSLVSTLGCPLGI